MFGFLNRGHDEVRHDHPALPAHAAIRSIDDQMAAVVRASVGQRTDEQRQYLDRMLDARLIYQRIRPAVPYVPGPDGERRPS